jgi:hypothetical protein
MESEAGDITVLLRKWKEGDAQHAIDSCFTYISTCTK